MHKQDVAHFLKAFENGWIRFPKIQNNKNPFLMITEFYIEKVFRKEWLSARFPVFLDYSTAKDSQIYPLAKQLNEILYLTPITVLGFRILFHYPKKSLIKSLKDRPGLNLEQMAFRCPNSRPVSTLTLNGYRLVYKALYGKDLD